MNNPTRGELPLDACNSREEIEALLPCPFTGKPAKLTDRYGKAAPRWWVECECCWCHKAADTPEEATRLWNTRAASAPGMSGALEKIIAKPCDSAAYNRVAFLAYGVLLAMQQVVPAFRTSVGWMKMLAAIYQGRGDAAQLQVLKADIERFEALLKG
jgi:hypothetical protein